MLFEARKLADFSCGRHAVAWDLKNPLVTPVRHLPETRDVADVLTLDAHVRAREGDIDGALVSIRAALVALHTLGDEPLLASQTYRLQWHALPLWALEASLRSGAATEEKLQAVQAALQAEADEPVLRIAARGQRAGLHGLLATLRDGGMPSAERVRQAAQNEQLSRILLSGQFLSLDSVHAWLLEYTTRLVEISALPPQDQPPRLKALSETALTAPAEAIVLLGDSPAQDLGARCHKDLARLRCAAAGVAVERYRLANGRFPDGLADLAPKYLTKVPTDPFDGRPLRYARLKGGAAVYSVGPGGRENGRTVGAQEFESKEGIDLAFRLWDAEARTRPAR
jgi:hypothetical protein